MAPRAAALLFQYRLLLAAIFPALALHALWLALKQRDLRYLRERLGFHRRGDPVELWIHAASVGEVNAVLPLVRELRARHHTAIVLTTATVSGAATARAKLPDVAHRYLPLDRTGGVRRFLRRVQPRCAIMVETEIWPNLYAACAEHEVGVIIINGRLSQRTLAAPAWVRDLYEGALSGVAAVLARSDADRARFIALGAPGERIEVAGNLKFAAAPHYAAVVPFTTDRPYVLAASTRDDEERLIVAAFAEAAITDHLLVIAPRHPARRAAILRDLAPHRVALRSRGDAITADTVVYLADTLGELPSFIAGAELVFMGGSLVAKGGQNLLEPAALGKAIITGPHMENFAAETETLRVEEGLVQVHDGAELAQQFARLLPDRTERARLGENARRAIDARRHVALRYADALERICGAARQSEPGSE